MNHTFQVYRSSNDLAYSELPPPDHAGLAPLDILNEDAIKKENALEFYRFELAFLQASGTQDQLETYAATKENFAKDERQEQQQPGKDDPVWAQIENEVKKEVDQILPKIHDIYTVSESHSYSADTKLVEDEIPQTSLLPSSIGELLSEVARKTGLNKLIEGWSRGMFFTAPAKPTTDDESLLQALRADALYSFLTAHICRKNSHHALLQLSGWGDNPECNNVFQLFLSCCEDNGWQRATCVFESVEPDSGLRSKLDICSEIQTARRFQVPLLLSFNNDKLWPTAKTGSILSTHEKTVDHVNLDTLLIQGDLKTGSLDDSVRRFRLALRLASSLYSLFFGPWVQKDWSSYNVHIIRNGSRRPVEMLDEAYVSCVLTNNWRQIYTPPLLSSAPPQGKESNEKDVCPRFFLSLAQLLVDIANGERSDRLSNPDDLYSWYNRLADEWRKNMDNELMKDYWKAIEGCLLYMYNYSINQSQRSADEEDERLRAQKVIHEHIVRHLQKHLNFWKEQQQRAQSLGDVASGSGDMSRPHGHGPRSTSAHRIKDGLSARRTILPLASLPPRARPVIEAKYTLWSDRDNDFTIIEEPTKEPSETSFVSRMRAFRDAYIETLPEPKGNGGSGQRVRVAILDTGLYIEELDFDGGDIFLDHIDVRSRIVAQRNFFSPDGTEPDLDDCMDEHGHGTLVARLVLQFAPRAEVVVAKITNTKSLTMSKTHLINALRWAGEQADIINLSFSLGSMPIPEVDTAIRDLLSANKLIFVAASNTGGFGSRLWPASRPGVFAIHATNEFGNVDINLNPQPIAHADNFATYGCDIESYWKGHHRSISGTSFATPVAAAIAANVLEYARRTLSEPIIKDFTRYSAMQALFRRHMTPNSVDGVYHRFHPWAEGLWDGDTDSEEIGRVLWDVSR
ncbi:hypothetical protein F5Y19DRAFT_412143 [Xylariaceae sp. FL1651]|nr:hypothetical protein F5Y19DRAFT_412143 [Xylariaceae sp. FL1651]